MGTYTKNTANRTPRPRSERLRRLGFIVNTSTSVSSSAGYGDGHTHANLAALDAITVDDGYIYLSDSVIDETTDSVTKVTVKASAGFADRAGANADGYTLDWFIPVEVNGVLTLKLNPIYAGLWADGWLAAGGVGTGGSGGSGLIETVYTWTELQAMASAPADDVTAAVNARGVYEIWQAVKALQNSTANVSLVNGSGSSTITVNSVSAEFYTKGQVDNLVGGLVNFHYEFAASTSAVTNPQSNVLYLIGPTGSGADKYEEYVYTDSSWKKIGDTSIDVSQFVTELGTSGNHLTWTKNGTTNNLTVPFATKATQDGDGNTISSTYLKLSGGTVTGSVTFRDEAVFVDSLSGYHGNWGIENDGSAFFESITLDGNQLDWFVPVTVNGVVTLKLNPVYAGLWADGWVASGGIGSSSSSGGALADLADVSLSSGLASGDLLKYDGTHWVNIPQSQIVPTVSVAFDDLTSHPTTLAGYGITDAKIENGVITLGGSTITPLTSIPDLSGTYLSLANGGTVAGAVDFGSGISGGQDWSINDRGEAAFADLTVNGSQVLTSHQTVTNFAATLTPGTTQTIATIGNTSITVAVPFFAMQQDIGTLNSYFTNGSANNALKLENHAASYFATATSVTDLTTRVTSLESMFEIVDGNVHVKNSMGLWSDSFISAGGVGTSGGGSGYGVEDITTEEDGTLKFHWTGGDVTTVDLNHTHDGLLPDVTSTDNGKIVKVVNGEWALATESGGGSTVEWTNGAQTNSAILTVGGTPKSLLLTSGLVTSLSSSSTDYQIPSAKCVYDIVGDIETLLAAL
ncbi:MAG: hypothetical protein IJP49_06175 [Bacteroidales bacterium]|nr:hypothetical protein [Bacteroidales bacterium]